MEWKDWKRISTNGISIMGLGLLLMVIGGWQEYAGKNVAAPTPTPELVKGLTQTMITVEIGGAVNKPGVYTLDAGKRIIDLIRLAEDFAENVDLETVSRVINQAEKLKDGQKIIIPSLLEMGNAKYQITNPSASSQLRQGFDGQAGQYGNELININEATQVELETLSGVGEVRAKAIIENRPYSSLLELSTKANIPESILQKNEGKISLY